MNQSPKLHGLNAAAPTPFDADGNLELGAIERLAEHLASCNITAVFINGTTGECTSLTVPERMAIAERWREVLRNSSLKLVVHVGSNCLSDSRTLAEHAAKLRVDATAAFAPSYFRPSSMRELAAWCQSIASAAPNIPFYFYDIPSMTRVEVSIEPFVDALIGGIANFAGIKYTNSNLLGFQHLLRLRQPSLDVLWGMDESLLAAWSLGAKGAIGSSYNFAAPIYHRMLSHFREGQMESAAQWQWRAAQLIQLLSEYGYLSAAKVVMQLLNIDLGATRLPLRKLETNDKEQLASRLDSLGFHDWLVEANEQSN